MAQDIIFELAWQCGDEPPECGSPGGWHKANYWVDETADTGFTVDNYSDGDHDSIEESDLPTPEDVARSWVEYNQWVAENGQDPLHQFYVPKEVTTQKRTYTVTLAPSILGPVILRLRRNHRNVGLDEIARVKELREYLMAEQHFGRWVVSAPAPKERTVLLLEDIADGKPIRNHRLTVTFDIEVPHPDADKRYRKELVSIASR